MVRKIVIFVTAYVVILVTFVLTVTLNVPKVKVNSLSALPFVLLISVGSLVVFGLPMIIFMLLIFRTPRWEKEVQETGKPAPAQVLEFRDLHVRAGRSHFFQAKVQVQPSDDVPFEASLEKPLTILGRLTPGETINVKYDPNDKRHIVLDRHPSSTAPHSAYGRN